MGDIKLKEERVKETITLLNKLPDIGVTRVHPLFLQIKDIMSAWVNMGPAVSERFDFGTHWGDLTLPIKSGKVASLNLKVKRGGRR